MKTIHRTAIALCLSLAILFLTIGSAAVADVIEIKGPLYKGEDIRNIIDRYVYGTTLSKDATEFTAFYYDITDDMTL